MKANLNRRRFLKGAAVGAAAGSAALIAPIPAAGAAAPQAGAPPQRGTAPPPSARALAAETGPVSRSGRPDGRRPRLRLHGGRDQVIGLRIRRLESRVELPIAPGVVHQLRRKQGSRVADLLPRRIVGRDGRWLFQGGRQADARHGARHGRPAARGDDDLQRVRAAAFPSTSFLETRSTRARGGRAWSGTTVSRTRPRWFATTSSGTTRRFHCTHFAESAVRAYKIAMTRADGAGRARGRRRPAGNADRRSIQAAHSEAHADRRPRRRSGAVAEVAKLLVAAENPIIVAGRAARTRRRHEADGRARRHAAGAGAGWGAQYAQPPSPERRRCGRKCRRDSRPAG